MSGALRAFRPVLAATLAGGAATVALAVCAPIASAAAPNCTTIASSLVKSELGVEVQATAQGSTSKFNGTSSLLCTYGATVNISYLTPATASGYNNLLATLKHATLVTLVKGVGTEAFSGTGTSTSSTFSNGKSTNVTVTVQNLWVFAAGTAMFEISAPKGSLSREESLAKRMVKLL